MIKKNLHPKLYKTKIIHENKVITELLTNQIELNILMWSGNHAFYNNLEKNLEFENYNLKFESKYKNIIL